MSVSNFSKRVLSLVFKMLLFVFALASFLVGLIMLQKGKDPFHDTFSIIGKRNPILFALYGIFTVIALFFNMNAFVKKLQFGKIRKIIFEILVVVCCVALLITCFVSGVEPPAWDFRRRLHVGMSMVFGILGFCLAVWLLITKFYRDKKMTNLFYLFLLGLSVVFFLVRTIQVGWFTAITQFLIIETVIFCLMFANLFDKGFYKKSMMPKES